MSVRVRELTPPGRGGVSVLELRGAGSLDAVARLARGRRPAPGELALLSLWSGDELLDEALCHVAEPERLELHLHGSPPLVRRVIDELGGSSLVEDLPASVLEDHRAAARELCAQAPSEAAARMLLDQAEGALERELSALGKRDGPVVARARVALLERGRVARHLLHPPLVVLAGPVNAGKSTLFNALVGQERVVVDPAEGTTRDAVRARALLGAYAVELCDTAGERTFEEASAALPSALEVQVERAGWELGRELRARADVVLWLAPDPSAPGLEAAAGAARSCVLTSRADELGAGERAAAPAPISARDDPEGAQATVELLVRTALGLPAIAWCAGHGVPVTAAACESLQDLSAR